VYGWFRFSRCFPSWTPSLPASARAPAAPRHPHRRPYQREPYKIDAWRAAGYPSGSARKAPRPTNAFDTAASRAASHPAQPHAPNPITHRGDHPPPAPSA